MEHQIITPEASRAIHIGREHHYRFRVVLEHDYQMGWVYDIYESDFETPIAGRARLEVLDNADIKYTIILVHEHPKLLNAPKHDFKDPECIPQDKVSLIFEGWEPIWDVFVLAILDPSLIVILYDGTWLEIMTWYE